MEVLKNYFLKILGVLKKLFKKYTLIKVIEKYFQKKSIM